MSQRKKRATQFALTALATALVGGLCLPAKAASLCVNPGGTGGCKSTISAAVAAANPGDTIQVAHGTYKEDVHITKSNLSLLGDTSGKPIINATGLPNGIFIDGMAALPANPVGITNVVVSGFTVENAKFEGILIANAASVTISGNEVTGNNLNLSNETCPGAPPFETAEGFDCGEGVHLIAVQNSTIANNQIENNSGGILISDETGPTTDNLILGNTVRNNVLDCGITLASHPPAIAGVTSPLGIMRNTIAQNISDHNGTAVPGAGAGVGIFGPLPGATVANNVIINNTLTNNGLPGVAFHAHTPGQNLNNNVIAGNFISGNGQDTEDAATPGTAGINVFGVSPITTTIVQNTFGNEAFDIVVNTPADVDVHLNNLGNDHAVGLDNIGPGTVNATENWWGCGKGPGAAGCTTAAGTNVLGTPWLTVPILPIPLPWP